MILVAGGTGTLGTRVVARLLARGETVRVLSRNPGAAGLPAAVEVVRGDVQDDAAVRAAVRGCHTVVSAVHGFAGRGGPSPEAVDRDGNRALVDASVAEGVERFVLVSVVGAAADHPMSLHRMKHAAEQAVADSGLPASVVRLTALLDTWIEVVGSGLPKNALVLGRGTNPITFIAADDAAAFVDLAAAGDERVGRVLEAGGPETLTMTDLARRLLEHDGSGGRIKRVPTAALRVAALAARPVNAAAARRARAAVVMNERDMVFDSAGVQARFPEVRMRTLADLLGD